MKQVVWCPYCGEPYGDNPHADHIYPIKWGGLSDKENMVFVCEDCNKKKKYMTLREFVKSQGLDWHYVERNLEKLHKRF